MLIVGRAVAGAGASGLLNGGINIVLASMPLQRRPRKSPRSGNNPYWPMLFLTRL